MVTARCQRCGKEESGILPVPAAGAGAQAVRPMPPDGLPRLRGARLVRRAGGL
jgi:hypothetical protein